MHDHHSNYDQIPEGSSNRNFGLIIATFFLIIGLLPIAFGHHVRLWAISIGALIGVIALVIPLILAPFNRLWTALGSALHEVVNPIALAFLFYGVVTPTGWMLRLCGKDPLRLHLDRKASSYWIHRTPPGPSPESLKNQF